MVSCVNVTVCCDDVSATFSISILSRLAITDGTEVYSREKRDFAIDNIHVIIGSLLIVTMSPYRITMSWTCSLLVCLAILRSVRNLIATPLITLIDKPSCAFQFPTRYNVVS